MEGTIGEWEKISSGHMGQLCKPKKMEELAVLDIKYFNLALLTK